jgi:hypothetical protein
VNYQNYINSKTEIIPDSGFKVSESKINPKLFDFQKAIVLWALRKGKASLFEDCGLGKSIQQLEWARQVVENTNKPVLILAPLAVSKQTKTEGTKFDIDVNICNSQADVIKGINITNYEKLHKFDYGCFDGIVLDESSIIKSMSGKIRNQVITLFNKTPYRLACTATPSPNDYMELGNHSEFMGNYTRLEMLAEFFVHDGSDTSKWKLKGYAESAFWKWLCSWSVYLRNPSDIGFNGDKFILPPIKYNWEEIKEEHDFSNGMLFPQKASTLSERRCIRRKYIQKRVEKATEIVEKSNGSQHLVWCDLNNESRLLSKELDAVEITGSDSPEHKEHAMLAFANGEIKRLVSKPKIAGFGINWQSCHNMSFVGLSDSWESFYQATRRCWRFGQKNKVNVNIIYHELEGNVIKNIQRKEKQAAIMADNLIDHMSDITKNEMLGQSKEVDNYIPKKNMEIPQWL